MVHDNNQERQEDRREHQIETVVRSTKSFFSLFEDIVSRNGLDSTCPVVSNPSLRLIEPEALNFFLGKILERTEELFGHLGSALEVKRERTLENILNGIHEAIVSEGRTFLLTLPKQKKQAKSPPGGSLKCEV